MNAPIAETTTISNPRELRNALRAIIKTSGMSRRKLDEVAGLPAGYTDKLLCEPPVRNIGPTSLFPLLWALSQRILFVPDLASKQKIEMHHMFQTRDERKGRGDEHWRNAKALSIIVERAKITGSEGGKARARKLTKSQRNKIASKAAHVRWAAHRRRLKLAQTSCAADTKSVG